MIAYRLHDVDAPPRWDDLPLPEPGPGEVRVAMRACGLNFADLLMLQGRYQERPDLPATLGLEGAGVVDALGAGVTTPAIGTRVAVFGSGMMASHAVVPAVACLPIPDAMTWPEAAGFQIAYATSHLGLARRANLCPGERLLVTGAAGGVGLTAIEIGKLMGAEVVASARGADKLAICREAGADHVIDADAPDMLEQLRALGGLDVTYDSVGGEAFHSAFRATRPEGRLLLIGFAGGDLPRLAPNHMLVKNISVIGHYMGAYPRFNPQALAGSLGALLEWYCAGRLHPHISHVLPYDQVAEGMDLLRSRRSTGKVVIDLPDGG
ncbi:MAG: zinc-binding dehydrogenase [Confluentimicrobium sp.]|nr:zinc-binding dehydrogenase [Actibacterium sp.]